MAEPGPRGASAVDLIDGPIDLGAITAALRDEAAGRAGAIVTFTGVVRGDGVDEDAVIGLRFETYPAMARQELGRIHQEAVQRFGLVALRIVHRTDALRVGEEIVAVAVASAHRDAAFGAAAWVMDELKRRVPLWKHETRADGTERWVPADHCGCGLHS